MPIQNHSNAYKTCRFFDIPRFRVLKGPPTIVQMLMEPGVFLKSQRSRGPDLGPPAAWPAGRPAMLIDEKNC